MIPLQLRVRNFICYRDNVPPLDFSGIHLACLTGANGHGKSALLDAMTWALWGRARSKRDDELIHQGQSEMEVEFTFELGGKAYRILRKRDSAGRGRTVLDLQIGHDGGFRSVAETTVRDTQTAINRLLRMDYETFTTSAFLLQGRADAFTSRTPAERKEVLAEILGLSLYDEHEERAKERAREAERGIAQLDAMLREINAELAREPQYQAAQQEAEQQVARLSVVVKEAEAALQSLRHEQQLLEHQRERLRDVERRLGKAEEELAEATGSVEESEKNLRLYQQTLADRREIEAGYARLLEARRAEGRWNERLGQLVQIQERQRALERAVDAARRELDLELGRLRERVRELERRAGDVPAHERNLQSVRGRLGALAVKQAEREAAQVQIQVLSEEAAGLQVRNDQLRAEMDARKEKIDWLRRQAEEALCPLCNQPLTEAHRVHLVTQFEAEGKAQAVDYRSNTNRRREIAGELERLQTRVRELDRDLAALPAEQRNEAQLEQALAQAREAADDLAGVRADLARHDERLAGGDYAPAEREALARLAAELQRLAYDAAAHQAARDEVAELAPFEDAQQRLATAGERCDQERAALVKLRARQERWAKSVAEEREQRRSLAADVARLPEAQRAVQAKTTEVDALRGQSLQARQALGAAQQRLDACRSLAAERERRIGERQRLAEEKGIFDELRLAFGKKGVQAMIIESVIPDIEAEANRLLARMTDGRMAVRFETQRETLAGDTVETLDIKIGDELGTRDYAMFSGGEAFRVNFAIRIALSKLLARRAGAQLQMLVLDEGFGTQDAEGRERLVEAITSIQDDFARVLVITHIEELKDLFPVQIQVTKTAEGSMARIQ
jgi:exonuclease SbcC